MASVGGLTRPIRHYLSYVFATRGPTRVAAISDIMSNSMPHVFSFDSASLSAQSTLKAPRHASVNACEQYNNFEPRLRRLAACAPLSVELLPGEGQPVCQSITIGNANKRIRSVRSSVKQNTL